MKLKNTSLFIFGEAFVKTRREMWSSLWVLLILTTIASIVMWSAEVWGGGESSYSLADALEWSFLKYIGDPTEVAPHAPTTHLGVIMGNVIGIIGILILAILTGLLASGFTAVYEEKQREEELQAFGTRLARAFRPTPARRVNDYLREKGLQETYSIAPLMQSVATLQTDYHMDMKDIMDAAEKFPEYRLANMASIQTPAEHPQDRIVLLHNPINRPYGCCIDRKSKVTIVVPSAQSELATEWFGYQVALFGGFNFISKSIKYDNDTPHSYFNMTDIHPEEAATKEEKHFLSLEQSNQTAFYHDLKALSSGDGHWNIYLLHVVTNSSKGGNHTHFNSSMAGGKNATIQDEAAYTALKQALVAVLDDYSFQCTTDDSERFPLMEKNVAYRLQKDGIHPNSFALRVGAHIMATHTFRDVIAYRFAEQIARLTK
ncbi:MAG: hypothetical protein II644_08315 [Paludibacteraceae bacterium]|nr:hypothetical protein [Paludibacteraceae bacterium]